MRIVRWLEVPIGLFIYLLENFVHDGKTGGAILLLGGRSYTAICIRPNDWTPGVKAVSYLNRNTSYFPVHAAN